MRLLVHFLLATLLTLSLCAQQTKDGNRNHTIDVTAEGSSSVEADIAVITVDCRNYGPNEQAAYEENARRGNRLLDALTKAGFDKNAIATSSISVGVTEAERDWTPEQKIERQNQAEQSLTLRVATRNAAAVVDLAMRSGATSLKGVNWMLSDDTSLKGKAMEEAMKNARVAAEQLAKGMGVKVGPVVSISNSVERERFVEQFWARGYMRWLDTSRSEPVTLLPGKITRNATVHVVYAME